MEIQVYKTVYDRPLYAALVTPVTQKGPVTVVCMAGCGWAACGLHKLSTGQWAGQALNMANYIASLGYKAVALDYGGGVAGMGQTQPEHWPAQLDDLEVGADFIRAMYDVTDIAWMGSSSGGHLALCGALHVPGSVAVLNFSGPSDLPLLLQEGTTFCQPISRLLGNCTDASLLTAASPALQSLSGFPKTLLVTFETDHVPAAQQLQLRDKLLAAGGVVTLFERSGTGHGFSTGLADAAKAPAFLSTP